VKNDSSGTIEAQDCASAHAMASEQNCKYV
jgi:hypothetical protein